MRGFADCCQCWKQAGFRRSTSASDNVSLFEKLDPQLMISPVLDPTPQGFSFGGALTELVKSGTSATVSSDPPVGPSIDTRGQQGRGSVVSATIELGRSGHTW